MSFSNLYQAQIHLEHFHHQGCRNNPIFSNLVLCAACWAHFICHHELWQTSVSHPFCFLNNSLGLMNENITREYKYLSLWSCFPNFCFSRLLSVYVLCYSYYYSLLSSVWVINTACGSVSFQGYFSVNRNIVNRSSGAVSQDKST